MNAAEPAPSIDQGTARTRPAPPPGSSTTTSRCVSSSARRTAVESLEHTFDAFTGSSNVIGREAGGCSILSSGMGAGVYRAKTASLTARRSLGSALIWSQRRSTHAPRSTCRLASCTSMN